MAYGDIGAAVDTLEFSLTDIGTPDMIQVAGDIYAIAYKDSASKGQVVTIDITAAGEIGAAVIDSLEFGAGAFLDPCIIHIAGDIYAIAYKDSFSHGQVCTVDIAADGAIGAAVIDSLEFIADQCGVPDIIHISGDIYAIAYVGAWTVGSVCTVDIATDGAIGAAVIDSLEFDAGDGNYPKICHVDGDVYAIAYTGDGQDGWVCTVDIAADGEIGAAAIDSFEFEAGNGYTPVICHVSGNIYAVAYRDGLSNGLVCTVSITGAGAIGAAVIDALEFEAGTCVLPDMIHVGGGIFAIAYGGTGEDGFICTVQIETDGEIGAGVIDVLEFDGLKGQEPSIVHVSGDTYVIAYKGNGDDGFMKTPTIETPVAERIKHLMMMGIG